MNACVLLGVDPTTQAFLAALIGAIVGGGAVLAWHVSERQQHQTTPVEEPVVPPGVATVLSVLRSSAVVVDGNDAVLKASAPAYALGLVRGTAMSSDELADLVRQVRRDGQIRETELQMRAAACPPATSPPGSHRWAAAWSSRSSRTAPASAASRPSDATSWPTSATS